MGGVELVEGFGAVVGVFDWEEGGGVEVLEVDVEVVGVVEVEEDIGEVYEVGGAPDLEPDEATSVTDVAEGEDRSAVFIEGHGGSAGGAGVSGEGVGADGEFDKEVEAVVVVVLTKFGEEGVKVPGEEFGGTDVGRVVCDEAAALVFCYGRSRSSVDGRRARERYHRLGRSTVVAEGGEEGGIEESYGGSFAERGLACETGHKVVARGGGGGLCCCARFPQIWSG